MSDNKSTITQLTVEADKLKNEGKSAEAIAKLQELLALEPNHVLTHMTLSVLYYRTKQFEQSVQHAAKACEIEPTNPFNFTALSVTYQRAFAGTQNRAYIQLAEDAMARAHMLQGSQHRH